ncbi:olfactory receptor-like protein OLF3 [Bufo gargarizans]|uniref:olfactory receptor-like protein OLF3 n=1 Tax=Bufo gargarizans TaxID=30331 RepID=UPI001CF28B83|nr:olfactory receptor-like protein OLF3 [Bufo gargarizans]
MEQLNQTTSLRFILLGLSTDPFLQVVFFFIFLIMYIITISGNLLFIIIVRINPSLHSPMFFFLTNLSMIDIIFSSSIVPVILMNTLSKDKSISLLGCVTQMLFSLAMGATEILILAFMAYDRFAAICRPLHYNTIMNKKLCFFSAAVSWNVGFMNSTLQVILTFQLPFCNSFNTNHYFCEVPAFIRMSCGDTFPNELSIYITGTILAIGCFYLILISYIHIISEVLKIISSEGRQKSISTCASHLTVVTLFFGTLMVMYLRPHSKKYTNYSGNPDKIVPILYTTVTPMLNPFIYSIRNKDVKNTLFNQLNRKKRY